MFNLEPAVTLVAAWMILGERLALIQLAGAALVLGSVLSATVAAAGGQQNDATDG
jgi:drug/metabolite transporter (DMT)-like permease